MYLQNANGAVDEEMRIPTKKEIMSSRKKFEQGDDEGKIRCEISALAKSIIKWKERKNHIVCTSTIRTDSYKLEHTYEIRYENCPLCQLHNVKDRWDIRGCDDCVLDCCDDESEESRLIATIERGRSIPEMKKAMDRMIAIMEEKKDDLVKGLDKLQGENEDPAMPTEACRKSFEEDGWELTGEIGIWELGLAYVTVSGGGWMSQSPPTPRHHSGQRHLLRRIDEKPTQEQIDDAWKTCCSYDIRKTRVNDGPFEVGEYRSPKAGELDGERDWCWYPTEKTMFYNAPSTEKKRWCLRKKKEEVLPVRPPCMTCLERKVEHGATTLCAACDRDEWRDATIRANKRFQYAEDQLKRILSEAGKIVERTGRNYPCNYDDLWVVLKEMNKEVKG